MERNIVRNNEEPVKRHVGLVENVARVGLATLLLGAGGAAIGRVTQAEVSEAYRTGKESGVVLPRVSLGERLGIIIDYMVRARDGNAGRFFVDECGTGTQMTPIPVPGEGPRTPDYPDAPWQATGGKSRLGNEWRPVGTMTKDGVLYVIEYRGGTDLSQGEPTCGPR
ncbi:MAG: hypothetical protein WC841_02550 [Candidatus Shapirobacteria bacterium]|jgi:hypothetical protein